jgi:hypothetical protein
VTKNEARSVFVIGILLVIAGVWVSILTGIAGGILCGYALARYEE